MYYVMGFYSRLDSTKCFENEIEAETEAQILASQLDYEPRNYAVCEIKSISKGVPPVMEVKTITLQGDSNEAKKFISQKDGNESSICPSTH